MPSTKDFRLNIATSSQGDEQGISAEIQPTPTGNCAAKEIRVNGQPVTKNTKAIGDIKVVNFGAMNTSVALRAPKDHPPIRIEIKVDCGGKNEKTFIANVLSQQDQNPLEATGNLLDGIIDVFKKIADFLGGGFKELLPEELRDGLKTIKGLVGKGLDIVSNLLPGLKLIPDPATAILLRLLPDNLEHLKKKIGEHLKDLDPLDDSPEAALADAEALRALILEDIIPFVQQVGELATNDLKQYTQRLSVMRKMTARLGDQLDLMGRTTKVKRSTAKRTATKRRPARKLK